jgi:hypothetical protein
MQPQVQRKKQDKIVIPQRKLLNSLENLTKEIIQVLEQDQLLDSFKIEQRQKVLNALMLSESVSGPIGAEEKTSLLNLQKKLEELLNLKIQQSHLEIVDYTSKTKDLKKYNLKNVR